MKLGAAILDTLTKHAALSAIVGARIYPVRPSDGQPMPFILWQRISTDPWTTACERTDPGDATVRVQFTVFAGSYDHLDAIAEALVDALDSVPVLAGHPATYDDEQDIPSDVPGVVARSIDFLL